MAFFPCNNNYWDRFAYCSQNVSSDSQDRLRYTYLIFDPKRHNKIIYTHTAYNQYTTRLIDVDTQTYTIYPNAAESRYSYGQVFVTPFCLRYNNAYDGCVFMIAFKDNEVEVVAEGKTSTTSPYAASVDCSGYRYAWVNYGGLYSWAKVFFIDFQQGTISDNTAIYGYYNRLYVSLSGHTIHFSADGTPAYYSVLGIK